MARGFCLLALSAIAPTGLHAFSFSQATFSSQRKHDSPPLQDVAERVAEESRVRTAVAIKVAYEMELASQRAAHKLEMAQQRVELLEGMVPIATHEGVVSTMAGDFSRTHEVLRAKVEQRDRALRRASSNVKAMSDSLVVLKRDVTSLRAASASYDEASRELAAEIRANEVQPQKLRADAAEHNLSELRHAALGWLSAAHAMKLKAVAEARKSGYADGRRGLSEQLARSHQERLALREEVAAARTEAVDMLAALGAAGASALAKSRDVWRAEGRAEGIEAVRQREEEAMVSADHEASKVREAFAAYIVSAHQQKLAAAAAEREAAREATRDLSEKLAVAIEILATFLKERVPETGLRRDSALSDVAAGTASATGERAATNFSLPPLSLGPSRTITTRATWEGVSSGAGATLAVAPTIKQVTTSLFWQDCGGVVEGSEA